MGYGQDLPVACCVPLASQPAARPPTISTLYGGMRAVSLPR